MEFTHIGLLNLNPSNHGLCMDVDGNVLSEFNALHNVFNRQFRGIIEDLSDRDNGQLELSMTLTNEQVNIGMEYSDSQRTIMKWIAYYYFFYVNVNDSNSYWLSHGK